MLHMSGCDGQSVRVTLAVVRQRPVGSTWVIILSHVVRTGHCAPAVINMGDHLYAWLWCNSEW